jgi:hypothetical protein
MIEPNTGFAEGLVRLQAEAAAEFARRAVQCRERSINELRRTLSHLYQQHLRERISPSPLPGRNEQEEHSRVVVHQLETRVVVPSLRQ